MVFYTKPPATEHGSIKNYAVVDLNKQPQEVREEWLRCLGRLRYWCFNTTNNRFKFGSECHRSAMIPEMGNFFIYLLYRRECMCLVIEGSTLYLVGFVMSSVGDIVAWEMQNMEKEEHIQFIEQARKMKDWYGNYSKPEEIQVGWGSLRSAFRGLQKHFTGVVPRASNKDVCKWCDTFVLHFPEAARFDSLGLCSIYRRFLVGGRVGEKQIARAQQWAKECRSALLVLTPVIDETKDKKMAAKKKAAKNKADKKKAAKNKEDKKKAAKNKEDKQKAAKKKAAKKKGVEIVDSLDLVLKSSQRRTEEEVQITIKDIRLFHRPDPNHITAQLGSMPFQLRDGEVMGNFPEDSIEEIEKMEFLMKSVHEFSHDDCDYLDGEWMCKGVDATNKEYTVGLYNLGNTCYVNSTLQCLHSVPELKSSLMSYPDAATGNDIDQVSHNLTLATSNVFHELDQSFQPIAPTQFLEMLHKSYPQFAHLHNNAYMQQDADECWDHLVNTLSKTITTKSSEFTAPPIKELFGIDLVNRVHCAKSGENCLEDAESFYSLKCHVSHDVDHIYEGLKRGLEREFWRHSPRLGQSAIYTGQAEIDELPRYLTVKFERLIWKKELSRNAKIPQKVEYPLQLDVYKFCSDELKQKLHAPRQMLGDPGNVDSTLKTHEKGSSSTQSEVSSSATAEEPYNMDIDEVELCIPKKKLTGLYDLHAVLTHKGSGEVGHYVSWVKQDDGKWVRFDDVDTSIHTEEDILDLCGGGDDHMAYICLYKGHMSE